MSRREYVRRAVALTIWSYGVWILLTWTATAEQLCFGAAAAVSVGLAMAPLGPVIGPWRLASPRRLVALVVLIGVAAGRIVAANLALTRRIWLPARPLRSGMVVVPTAARTDAELAATGLVTSLIVDNQLVDIQIDSDRSQARMQFHAMAVPEGDRRERINGPVERAILRLSR